MTPFWSDDHLTLYGGDCREVLRELPDESVHCVVTSPPYWGLRDYGIGDKGLGLEATPEEFVANMVAVFREVRRVMRPDATLWLNLGDSYASGEIGRHDGIERANGGPGFGATRRDTARQSRRPDTGLKQKDLVGIPWRVAFALQADGWYLRSDIIWAKPNPMPESVTDRPTKAHEYLFLLTKAPRYYYDAEAVREPHQDHNVVDGVYQNPKAIARPGYSANTQGWVGPDGKPGGLVTTHRDYNPAGRNLRSVWNIATEPYPGAHFATFPRKLVEPCVKAGTSERGVCPECGTPWVRETSRQANHPTDGAYRLSHRDDHPNKAGLARAPDHYAVDVTTTGWRPTCKHVSPLPPAPAVVLDPFAGSGTTLLVAQALGRRGVGIDLSPDYLKQALARNRQTPLGLVG